MTVGTLIVAAGSGERFGGLKQFERVGGVTLLDSAIAHARSVSNRIVVALPVGVRLPDSTPELVYTYGDDTRSGSVANAFRALGDGFDYVLIHDAARPFASEALFERVVAALARGCAAVVPAIASADTLKLVEQGMVRETLDRSRIVRVQTPQGFAQEVLAEVVQADRDATDEAAIAEQLGYPVTVVAGEELAAKVTVRSDLDRLRTPRVGLGFDIHPFDPDGGGDLILAGEHFGPPGLVGHSDGDCLAHAVADAILGAAGIGGIGDLFSDTDPALRGADSMELLGQCLREVVAKGYQVHSIDATIIAERPRLGPSLGALGQALEVVLGTAVLVKAKRAEGLGAIGAGLGIATLVVASLL
ncbi:2-C-methyl-D-erythritol 2,4-cyclodiphosphate synthase [Ferrimicrobium sp.]|uniref:2-C-methyl-D-erythritol 2,4-cyclodiphosphate synthase n=1 Tax=Ferrimicrobium sp. TaxID=2926050 RepID=UPI002618C4D7|nr:2-C-methyl-D-erythritol 2,4-cyclodiphosphate synthase [Ferrimicrobium sp.]